MNTLTINAGRIISILAMLATMVTPSVLHAESYLKGEPVWPVFEGWRPNPDGTFNFMFGYMNENWEEQPQIPVGDNNYFTPGELDRNQPGYFLPRRNRFTFEVTVPADWGDRELVWTLNHNGVESKAYATLKDDYLVDNMVIASETGSLGLGISSPESRKNVPPVVSVRGDTIRTARVGESITLITHVADDGLPNARSGRTISQRSYASRIMQPPQKPTVDKTNGLYLSWNVYRGSGDAVSFDPPQVKPWEDTRTSANSPWGGLWMPPAVPEDGIYAVTATFTEPGTYILWGRADDGGLYHDGYITVNVSP